MSLNVTHTFATLEVSDRTFKEIKRKLTAADYGHTFINDGKIIDMHGIGLVSAPRRVKKRK